MACCDDVQQVLDALKGLDRFDDDALRPLLDFCRHDVVWDTADIVVDGCVFHGRDGIRAFFTQWLANWAEWDFDVEVVGGVGCHVVTEMREWGVSRWGVAVEQTHRQVWTIRGGRLAHLKVIHAYGGFDGHRIVD